MPNQDFADTELANEATLLPIGFVSSHPIPFPDPEKVDRERRRRQRAERERQLQATLEETRLADAVAAASENARLYGHDAGFKDGFRKGTHWGMFCGAISATIAIVIIAFGSGLAIGWISRWH